MHLETKILIRRKNFITHKQSDFKNFEALSCLYAGAKSLKLPARFRNLYFGKSVSSNKTNKNYLLLSRMYFCIFNIGYQDEIGL